MNINAGMGLSFISTHTLGLELDVVGLSIVRDWFVIHLRGKLLSPIAAAFRAFLVARYQAEASIAG